MAQSSQFISVEAIKRGVVSLLYVLGAAFTAYNITAFKTDKFGLYFIDGNQLWLGIGVGMIVTGWLIRNWKKL